MKHGLISLIFLLCSFTVTAAARLWDGGGGDGLWSTAANWVGDFVPASADDVVLDNSIVAGSYLVSLPPGAVSISVNSLTITPSPGNTITLLNPVTNTAPAAFTATGPGDAVVLNNGAVFKNSSGASGGTPIGVTLSNFFRINNGGRYIHNCDKGHTTTLAARLSSATGTENGTFEFDVPASSFTVSLSGRIYGNLELSSAAHGGSIIYVGNGSMAARVNGNLLIHSAATLTLDFTNNLQVNGSLMQDPSSVFNLSNSTGSPIIFIKGNIINGGTITESGSGLPEMQLNGTGNQDLSGTGAITNSVALNLNNAAGATLVSPLLLPYKLLLTNGRIKTNTTSMLAMADNAICSGGSPSSFVEGPMKKIGDDNFVFPIGIGGIYAPIGIMNMAGQAVTDEFISEYKRANPQSSIGNTYQPPLDHISYVEYWVLARAVGAASKRVSLAVNFASFCMELSRTYVSHHDGSQWNFETSSFVAGPASPPFVSGTVSTAGAVTNFGPFTLSTDLNFGANPLPLRFVSFNAIKLAGARAALSWELADYAPSTTQCEIQRAARDKEFMTIGIINGNMSKLNYSYADNDLKEGVNYYRIKITDMDGVVTYSRVIAILNDERNNLIIALLSTFISQNMILTISSSIAQRIDLVVINMQGRVVQKGSYAIMAGNTSIEMPVDALAAGRYLVVGITREGKSNTVGFIKQ